MTNDIMGDFWEKLEERMENTRTGNHIEYPIEVAKISILGHSTPSEKSGSWVSVRPVAEEHGNKTFLGIYLGDLPYGGTEFYNVKTKELEFIMNFNPALYVPDLKKIVWGMESWWGVIDSPEKLRKISDADIQNTWYVKALKELEGDGGVD